MPPDIRKALHEAAPTPKGPLDIIRATRRGRKLAWQRRAAVAFVAVVGSVTVWMVATSLPVSGLFERPFPAGEGGPTSPQQASDPSTCTDRPRVQEVDGAYGTMVSEATTTVVKIASGEREGQAWSLCAYRARIKTNDEVPRDSLCEEFKFGPGPYAGYTCLNLGADAPSGADYFSRAGSGLSKEEGAAYYGAISQRVQRVVLRLRGGTEIEATISEPPEELGVDYKFFVGFAPPSEDVTVSVEDESGRELEKEFWEALPSSPWRESEQVRAR